MTHIVIGATTIGFCFGWWTADEARRIARRRGRQRELDFSSPRCPRMASRDRTPPRRSRDAIQSRKPW